MYLWQRTDDNCATWLQEFYDVNINNLICKLKFMMSPKCSLAPKDFLTSSDTKILNSSKFWGLQEVALREGFSDPGRVPVQWTRKCDSSRSYSFINVTGFTLWSAYLSVPRKADLWFVAKRKNKNTKTREKLSTLNYASKRNTEINVD
jgi:hypothetical protein